MDPFYDIDLVRLEAALTAAMRKTESSAAYAPNSEYPRKLPFKHHQIIDFFEYVEKRNKSRDEKNALRSAISVIIAALEPASSCPVGHCKDWSSRHVMSCYAGNNPKRCEKVEKYWAKKEASSSACTWRCPYFLRRDPDDKRATHKTNVCWGARGSDDAPEGCPKVKGAANV